MGSAVLAKKWPKSERNRYVGCDFFGCFEIDHGQNWRGPGFGEVGATAVNSKRGKSGQNVKSNKTINIVFIASHMAPKINNID